MPQIQQLASTEGSEFGQLAAVRSTAFAKVYQKLTPDQKTKLEAMVQARHERHQRPSPDGYQLTSTEGVSKPGALSKNKIRYPLRRC